MQARLRSGVRRAQSLVRGRAAATGSPQGSFAPALRHHGDAPALLLSPHWDDAALSCWGLLAEPGGLEVVNVFAGLPPAGDAGRWEALAGLADSRERASARAAEDARALAGAGREPRNLPLLDAGFRTRPLELGPAAIDDALTRALPSASRVYAPAGIGGHADHVLVRDYARALARAGMPVELYAELPYCAIHGWPAWVDGGEPEERRDVEAYWAYFLAAVPEMPPLRSARITRLAPDAAAAKLAAVSAYGAVELRWALPAAAG